MGQDKRTIHRNKSEIWTEYRNEYGDPIKKLQEVVLDIEPRDHESAILKAYALDIIDRLKANRDIDKIILEDY